MWRRSKKAGLNLDQKLLYILLHLQNWVSTARDAMVQSYEPEKMHGRFDRPNRIDTAKWHFFTTQDFDLRL